MKKPAANELESDPRFPSGPWTGFFLQRELPGRHTMELLLTFQSGAMTGEGRDCVGTFSVDGHYSVADGKCYWNKHYRGKHDVFYNGYNEGKGIFGKWEIPPEQNMGMLAHGGFCIWPEGMHDPTMPELRERADVPIDETQPLLV